MSTYYNEYEPYAAQWLRNLIKEGHIPDGEVDTRSILAVSPDDLRGFVQCHFFAGLGGWAYAARLAGWPDDRPLWTGSAPCQPFSTAGQQKGTADERHLWPVFFGLIRACRPPVVMGEQVAAAVGKDWLDGVSSDLEGIGYACGAVVVPACAVDAPHRRDRLWFVADSDIGQSRAERGDDGEVRRVQKAQREPEHGAPVSGRGSREDGDVADAEQHGRGRQEDAACNQPPEGNGSANQHSGHSRACDGYVADAADTGLSLRGYPRRSEGNTESRTGLVNELERCDQSYVADAGQVGRDGWASPAGCEAGANAGAEGRSGGDVADADSVSQQRGRGELSGPQGPEAGRRNHGPWDTYQWAIGSDGKARRVEPSIRLLAHGVPARVGKLRAYGNAIVPQVAAEIIGAYMDGQAQ